MAKTRRRTRKKVDIKLKAEITIAPVSDTGNASSAPNTCDPKMQKRIDAVTTLDEWRGLLMSIPPHTAEYRAAGVRLRELLFG